MRAQENCRASKSKGINMYTIHLEPLNTLFGLALALVTVYWVNDESVALCHRFGHRPLPSLRCQLLLVPPSPWGAQHPLTPVLQSK